MQWRALETNRAATSRVSDKTKSLPHAEDTRQILRQEGHSVKTTGEAQQRETPAYLPVHKNSRVREEISDMVGSEIYCAKKGSGGGY